MAFFTFAFASVCACACSLAPSSFTWPSLQVVDGSPPLQMMHRATELTAHLGSWVCTILGDPRIILPCVCIPSPVWHDITDFSPSRPSSWPGQSSAPLSLHLISMHCCCSRCTWPVVALLGAWSSLPEINYFLFLLLLLFLLCLRFLTTCAASSSPSLPRAHAPTCSATFVPLVASHPGHTSTTILVLPSLSSLSLLWYPIHAGWSLVFC